MKTKFLFFFLIITTFITSCSENNSRILTQNPTVPLRWEGITLGISSKKELLSALTASEMIQPDTIKARGKPWSSFDDIVYFKLNNGELGQAYINGDRVVLIELSNLKQISISLLIELYGNPGKIYIHGVLGKGFLLGDALHILIEGIYPEQGIIFGYDSSSIIRWKPRKITPGTEIDWIDYFNPIDYKMLLESGVFSLGPKISEKDLLPWKGFGKVEDLYPGVNE